MTRFRGMGADIDKLRDYAQQCGWLRLEPKGQYEIERYHVSFRDKLYLLIVYRNERNFGGLAGKSFARILLAGGGMRQKEQRELNLRFFREIRDAVKWRHWAEDYDETIR